MPRDDDQAKRTAERAALMMLTAADLIARLEALVWPTADGADERLLGASRG